MRRILGYLAATVVIGVVGTPQPADAAAFLWIAGNNFSYSAAACETPGAAFYAWFLAAGAGATTTAWTACSGPFGGSSSFAIAQAGTGGGGAAFAGGIADPYSGIEVGTTLTDFSNPSNYDGDSTSDSSEFEGTGYTLSSTGITFDPSATDSEVNGLDEIAAYLYTGGEDQSTLCSELGGSDCGVSDSTQAGDVTDLSTLQTDLGLTALGSLEVDPVGLGGSTINFGSTVNPDQVILVGQGDDASTTPEPASIALFGAGLCLIGWRLRRQGLNRLFRR